MKESLSTISSSMNLLKNNKKNKVKKYILSILRWICTFIIWGLIGVSIYIFSPGKKPTKQNFLEQYEFYSIKQKLKIIVITAIIIFYIIYIILEFFSPIFIFLKQDDEKSLTDLMEKIFKTKPSFFFRYISHKLISEEFEYNYWRDISGLFELNITNEEYNNKKIYIMLEINYEITFADKKTEIDYDLKKKQFEKKINKKKGNIKYIKEVKEIKEVKKYYKVKIHENDDFFIDFCLYIIFTILTLSEFYKLYINSKIVYEKFIIIKTVSTNTDLKKSDIYNSYNPQLKIADNVINYGPNTTSSFYNNPIKNKNGSEKKKDYDINTDSDFS